MKRKTIFLAAALALLVISTSAQDRYFRQIAYNHVSPHVGIKGIHEIQKEEAGDESHYIFSYDDQKRLAQIINNHYATERRHPLASIGAYRTVISYSKNKEVWTYFDKNGNPIDNDRHVFKEEFIYEKGFKSQLNFYDLDGNSMESMWKVSTYKWKKKGKMVIERRYNLAGEEVKVSPYFPFGTTGIVYGKDGLPKAHYNLDENLKVVNNEDGLASYKDEYSSNGNHIKWSYYDESDKLVKNAWGYAYGTKSYDAKGNFLGRKTFDVDNNLLQDRPMTTNAKVRLAEKPSDKDSAEIVQISVGYLEALQELDSVKMKRVMHTQLAKRTIGYDWKEETETIRETSYDQMVSFSKSWNKSGNKFPFNPSNEAEILDIYDRIATVKLVSDNWVEYLQLIKQNGEWRIINLLWSHKNVDAYSHHSIKK